MGRGTSRLLAVGFVLMWALVAHPAAGQDPSNAELKRDIQALGAAVSAVQKDLQDIKALLQQRGAPQPAPQNVVLDLASNPSKGDNTARLTLVEFTDYQCPFCSRHFRETYPQIQKDYDATGKLRYVVLDLPLESIHKNAFKAAVVANCAGEQGKYWEMHDRLFSNQPSLDAWNAHAEAVGLDITRFEACLNGGKQDAEIRRDMAQAQIAGLTGTPGFLLAVAEPGPNKVKTLRTISGAQPYQAFKTQIDALLAAQDAEGAKTR